MGKLEGGRTEWKTEVIFPVLREMTNVAAVSSPDTMAREEVRTVIGGCCAVDMVSGFSVADQKLMILSIQRRRSATISIQIRGTDKMPDLLG